MKEIKMDYGTDIWPSMDTPNIEGRQLFIDSLE